MLAEKIDLVDKINHQVGVSLRRNRLANEFGHIIATKKGFRSSR